MALKTWKDYLISRAVILAPTGNDQVAILQNGTVFKISISELLAVEIGEGEPVTLAVESTFDGAQGTLFLNPAEGTTVPFHLPVYGSVSAGKRFSIKNICQGLADATLDAGDGKTIDGEAIISIMPGEKITVVKDGVNWQTI